MEANFLGCLDDEKVDKDAAHRELVVRKSMDNSLVKTLDSTKEQS